MEGNRHSFHPQDCHFERMSSFLLELRTLVGDVYGGLCLQPCHENLEGR